MIMLLHTFIDHPAISLMSTSTGWFQLIFNNSSLSYWSDIFLHLTIRFFSSSSSNISPRWILNGVWIFSTVTSLDSLYTSIYPYLYVPKSYYWRWVDNNKDERCFSSYFWKIGYQGEKWSHFCFVQWELGRLQLP